MRRLTILAVMLVVAALPAGALAAGFKFPTVSTKLGAKPKVGATHGAAPKTLKVKDVVVGKGRVAKSGDQVTIQYVGKLYRSGQEFDASWNRGQAFAFALGSGHVIKGFDRGIKGMHVGGRRIIVIPPRLGYGAQGAAGAIPPNATLIFVVDLVSARP